MEPDDPARAVKKGINMKKACFVVTMILVLSLLTAALGSNISLPVKMSRQLEKGSGLKGKFQITVSGIKEPVHLDALKGSEFHLRGILSSDNDLHYFIYQEDEAENQINKTEIYRRQDEVYFRSDLLQGTVYKIGNFFYYFDDLLGIRRENPTLTSYLFNLIFTGLTSEQENNALNQYTDLLEQWLNGFSVETVTHNDAENNTLIDMNYVIPMQAVRDQMLQMLELILQNPDINEKLSAQMTDLQKFTYLNPSLMYYYKDALENMNTDSDIVLSRTVTAKGETVSSIVELPLDPEYTGFSVLVIENTGRLTSYTLKNEDYSLTVIVREGFKLGDEFDESMWIITRPAAAESDQYTYQSVRIDLKKTIETSYNDEDTTSHETDHYTISAEQDFSQLKENDSAEQFSVFEPIQFEMTMHYYSKSPESAPTTLELNLKYLHGDKSAQVTGKFKTASPWLFTPFEIGDQITDLSMEKPEMLLITFEDWLAHADGMLVKTIPNPESTETESGLTEGE